MAAGKTHAFSGHPSSGRGRPQGRARITLPARNQITRPRISHIWRSRATCGASRKDRTVSAMDVAQETERDSGAEASSIILAVADELTDRGLDVGGAWEGSHFLKITNVRGAFCEVAVREGGWVRWEYRPLCVCKADPAQVWCSMSWALTARNAATRRPSRI